MSALGPTREPDRIRSLDVLRGVAVLGILVMNIQSFSMVGAAYFNPTAFGSLEGWNGRAWMLSHVLADQKFMTLFSLLFGAGILLMASRAEAKGQSPYALHYKRTLGLLLFGLVHAYLFWYGDVLVWYSLCALLVFFFRRWKPRTLLILGLLSLLVPFLLFLFFGWAVPHMPEQGYKEMLRDWAPSYDQVQAELSTYRSGWLAQMEHRVPTALVLHTFVFSIWAGWRAGGLMLIGMALLKWGVLSAARSNRFYISLLVIGLGAGCWVVWLGVERNFEAGWSLEYSRFLGSQFNYWGSLLVSMGYLSSVMLLIRAGLRLGVLAAVGRMAFTNYLLQTLICTTIFYGHGLGLFGRVERTVQLGIVVSVWLFLGLLSWFWLKRFRFGPFEWLWRSLTYGAVQPLART